MAKRFGWTHWFVQVCGVPPWHRGRDGGCGYVELPEDRRGGKPPHPRLCRKCGHGMWASSAWVRRRRDRSLEVMPWWKGRPAKIPSRSKRAVRPRRNRAGGFPDYTRNKED